MYFRSKYYFNIDPWKWYRDILTGQLLIVTLDWRIQNFRLRIHSSVLDSVPWKRICDDFYRWVMRKRVLWIRRMHRRNVIFLIRLQRRLSLIIRMVWGSTLPRRWFLLLLGLSAQRSKHLLLNKLRQQSRPREVELEKNAIHFIWRNLHWEPRRLRDLFGYGIHVRHWLTMRWSCASWRSPLRKPRCQLWGGEWHFGIHNPVNCDFCVSLCHCIPWYLSFHVMQEIKSWASAIIK